MPRITEKKEDYEEESLCQSWPTLDAWMASVPDEEIWLCEDLVPEKGLTFVSGHSKVTNKSFFVDLLMMCVASGQKHDVIKPLRATKVIAVQAEGHALGIKGRFECYMREYGFPESCLKNIIYSLKSGIDVLDPKWQNSMLQLVKDEKPSLMVWDPLTSIHLGNDVDNQEMQKIVAFARNVIALDCAVLVVVHLNKTNGTDRDRDIDAQVRGATALVNGYDSHIAFRKYSDEEPIEFIVRSKIGPQQDLIAEWDIKSSDKKGGLQKARFKSYSRDSEEGIVATVPAGIVSKAEALKPEVGYTSGILGKLWSCKADLASRYAQDLYKMGILEPQGRKWFKVY